MIRITLIEQILRAVYGDLPSQDAKITDELVNTYINYGVGIAAKQCYKEAIQVEGMGYVNNGFYYTFKGLSISQDENFLWKITLPQIPIGIGTNEGVASLKIKDSLGQISKECVPLSSNQLAYIDDLRNMPNTVYYYTEGDLAFIKTSLILTPYTATVRMISGGDATDLNSNINVPDDYIPIIYDYVYAKLMAERMAFVDDANDGSDAVKKA